MRARSLLLAVPMLGLWAAVPGGAATTPRCGTGDLAGAIIDVDAGAGQRNARLILTNTSTVACHTRGYIGGLLVSKTGADLPTDIRRTGAKTRTVTLQPGAAGAVGLHWTVIPSGNGTCPAARVLRVTPPDESTTLSVFFGDTACEGRIDVGPIKQARHV